MFKLLSTFIALKLFTIVIRLLVEVIRWFWNEARIANITDDMMAWGCWCWCWLLRLTLNQLPTLAQWPVAGRQKNCIKTASCIHQLPGPADRGFYTDQRGPEHLYRGLSKVLLLHWVLILSWVETSASKRSIQRLVNTAFSWLKAATAAFTFKTLLRH